MSAIQQMLLAGAPAATAATWDPAYVSSPHSLANSNTRLIEALNNSAISRTVPCTKGVSSGKWYWEVKWVDFLVGGGETTGVGIAESNFPFSTKDLGSATVATSSGGLWNDGKFLLNGAAGVTIMTALALNDIVMYAHDVAGGKLYLGKNGTWSGSANPAAGTGAQITGLSTSSTYYPAATPWSSSASHTVTLDILGATNSNYSPPTGFALYSS
jgi:hypothetical protein